jgi:hypothetical protein
VILGTLARNLPAIVALAVVPAGKGQSCGMESAIDCAFRGLPTAFAKLIQLGATIAALAMVLAGAGVVALVWGGRRAALPKGLAAVGAGVAAVMPLFWLAVSVLRWTVGR